MPDFSKLRIFAPKYRHEEPGAYTMKEIREANRQWEYYQVALPPWMIPVPKGFSKDLPDEELNRLVWADIAAREEAKRALEQAPTL